ncbi:hypothetical protein [Inquilinus sp. Marseille-Q2685]|nr:hypothetical protein [Inquilinus sp. Marseille-Q2685]
MSTPRPFGGHSIEPSAREDATMNHVGGNLDTIITDGSPQASGFVL